MMQTGMRGTDVVALHAFYLAALSDNKVSVPRADAGGRGALMGYLFSEERLAAAQAGAAGAQQPLVRGASGAQDGGAWRKLQKQQKQQLMLVKTDKTPQHE